MKKKTLEFLEAHQSETPSTWREEAEWRRDNWKSPEKLEIKASIRSILSFSCSASHGVSHGLNIIKYSKRRQSRT